MSNVTLIGNKTVLVNARQAVLDTGSSVITASTADANTINSVSPASEASLVRRPCPWLISSLCYFLPQTCPFGAILTEQMSDE